MMINLEKRKIKIHPKKREGNNLFLIFFTSITGVFYETLKWFIVFMFLKNCFYWDEKREKL